MPVALHFGGGKGMRTFVFTLGLAVVASMASANPPAPHSQPTHPQPTTNAVQTHGNPHTTTPTPKPPTKPASGSPAAAGATGTSGSATTTSAGTTATVPKMNPIATKISTNHGLSSKVTSMLSTVTDPNTGKPITLDAASMGFKNQGQFIAALHVSKNLGIPFLTLKSDMVTSQTTATGTTMSQTASLGQAIQKVKGAPDSTAVTTAETQADNDIASK